MGTGNPGVFSEWPQPQPLNTPTHAEGWDFLWVRVNVLQGFKGKKPPEGCSKGHSQFRVYNLQYKFTN